jgi:hypothetical protein
MMSKGEWSIVAVTTETDTGEESKIKIVKYGLL